MAAKIRKNDLVEVVRGRTSDEKALAKRNARRAEEGLEPLKPGDKGKQGRVIQVFPAEGKVLVEGVNLIDRGYEHFTRKLHQLDARVRYLDA